MREARIGLEVRQLERVDERPPELLLVAEDDDPAVTRPEVLRGHERLVPESATRSGVQSRFSVQIAK